VEEALLAKDLCILSLKSRDVSPREKWLNMTRKSPEMQSKTEEMLVKADASKDLLKEV